MSSVPVVSQAEWQLTLTDSQARAAQLFGKPDAEQLHLGYFHTLREICQQPWTWLRTCDQMIASRDVLREIARDIRSLAFTGSGSSEYAGDCVRIPLQNELGIPVESISGGALLLDGAKALPVDRPGVDNPRVGFSDAEYQGASPQRRQRRNFLFQIFLLNCQN